MRGLTPRSRNRDLCRSTSSVLHIDWVGKGIQPAGLLVENRGSRILPTQEPGFLGSTSYHAVLTEDQDQAGIDNALLSPASYDDTNPQLETSQIGSRRMVEALALLMLLRDFGPLQRFIERWSNFDHYISMIDFFVEDCSKSINSDLVQCHALKSESALESAAERIFRNTCKKVQVSKTSRLVDFAKLFTGKSLRWEALAVFFTACGLCCHSMRCTDSIFDVFGHREQDKRNLEHRLLEASNTCVSFCEDAGSLSDLGMWVHYENMVYSTQVLGDTHYLVWTRLGATIGHIITQGLHTESKSISDLPFWLVELHRRVLACTFSIDKLLCTFVGRPPRLSQRYCYIHIPLDLEPLELAYEGEQLKHALSNIDENGWNRMNSSKIQFLRSLLFCSQLREEVLEICLGPPQSNMLEKSRYVSRSVHFLSLIEYSRDLIRRNQELLDSLPAHMRYHSSMWETIESSNVFLTAHQYLDILYNEFMIRRLMCHLLQHDSSELLQLSHKIVSVVVEVSHIRGSHISNTSFPWIMVFYGLPSAGLLSFELLRRKQSGASPVREISWSQAIQDLSVFIAGLKYVHVAGDGNYQLTQKAYKTLQQILERLLSGDESPLQENSLLPPLGPLDIPDELMDGFAWLDNSGFDVDFWMNLSTHSV